MSEDQGYGKLILVDTNLFFVKRLTEELQKQGLEVIHCTEPAYALTAVEWNMPVAILCATNLTNSDVYTIPGILHADERTRHIAVVAIGDGGEQPLLDAFLPAVPIRAKLQTGERLQAIKRALVIGMVRVTCDFQKQRHLDRVRPIHHVHHELISHRLR